MEPLLVSVEDAAKAIGLGKSKLYELLLSGQLKSLKIGRRRLISRHDLNEFIDGLVVSLSNDCDVQENGLNEAPPKKMVQAYRHNNPHDE